MPVSPTPGIAAIASIGEIATAVTPMMIGRRMPNGADADRLDQGGDAAGEQIGVDQHRDLILRQMKRAAKDQRHGDGVGIHHQDMLKPRANSLGGGNSSSTGWTDGGME